LGPKEDYDIPFENISNLEWIGGGSQGAVFKGTLRAEHVAVKKVKSKEEANVKHLCRLQHPNLVKIKGVSLNCDNFFCIIMEYCPYGQLYSYLNKNEKNFLKPAKTLLWAKQVASAMNYLHLNKIIHRDLKSPK
jgi:mitogen-activated protein kinase kinase kinase 13